jgi:hypothetical protein
VLADYGSEHAFARASASVLEHYGFEVGASTVRVATFKHARRAQKKLQQQYAQPFRALPAAGQEHVIAEADGTTICIVQPGARKAKRYQFRLKTLAPVYSQVDKAAHCLRLVVIESVPYRRTKSSKLERGEPAFLICTDLNLPLEKGVQFYLWRWDIEVNFRDEKTLLGVGQAQVQSEASNQNAPALAVAAYALLLLGAVKTYGADGQPETFKRPRWYKRKPGQRATTNELITQ